MAPEIKSAKDISEVLTQLMETESISIEKLSTLTDIPSRFIIALKEGEFSKLPADPYVRGYLIKIAGVLKTESEMLIQAYKDSVKAYKTSTSDSLPGNKYAKVPINKKWIVPSTIIVLLLSIIIFRYNSILGIPTISLDIPTHITTESLKITGKVKPGDKISLNGETVYTDESGGFEKDVFLSPGLNTFEFKVKRFLGQEGTFVKQVYYDEPVPPPAPAPLPPAKFPTF